MTCPRCAELAEYARSAMGNASHLIATDALAMDVAKTPEQAMAFRAGTYEFRLDWIAKRLAEHAEEHGRVEPLGATVICSEGLHEVKPGEDCPECNHGCSTPGDARCPGHGGDAPA